MPGINQGLIETAMENLKKWWMLIKWWDGVETPDGHIIVVSRVTFGLLPEEPI